MPVFVGDEVAFWSVNRAHQSDIGGSTHGAYNPGATEIWQEGLRIPPLKLYEAGDLRDDVCADRDERAPPARLHRAISGHVGSARVGERRLLALTGSTGPRRSWRPWTRSWTAPSCRRACVKSLA